MEKTVTSPLYYNLINIANIRNSEFEFLLQNDMVLF